MSEEDNGLETGPVFAHDCEQCEFLGSFDEHDLYYCGKSVPTVIARWGGEGPEYTSGIPIAGAFSYKTSSVRDPKWSKALRVAYLIAKDAGKIKGTNG